MNFCTNTKHHYLLIVQKLLIYLYVFIYKSKKFHKLTFTNRGLSTSRNNTNFPHKFPTSHTENDRGWKTRIIKLQRSKGGSQSHLLSNGTRNKKGGKWHLPDRIGKIWVSRTGRLLCDLEFVSDFWGSFLEVAHKDLSRYLDESSPDSLLLPL